MRRWMLVLLAVLSVGAPVVVAQSAWTTFAPPGAAFTISVPAAPDVLPVERETFNGKPYEIRTFRISTPGLIYLFTWTDYNQPVDGEGELDMNRDNFVKALNGRLTGETRISQNGVAGRDITVENADALFISRIFVSGSRAWQAVVAVRPGTDDSRSAMKFLYSLQLTGR